MICPDCGREHCHEPGEFLIVEAIKISGLNLWMAVIYDPEKNYMVEKVEAKTTDELENQVHSAAPQRSLHWHWPADLKNPQQDLNKFLEQTGYDIGVSLSHAPTPSTVKPCDRCGIAKATQEDIGNGKTICLDCLARVKDQILHKLSRGGAK